MSGILHKVSAGVCVPHIDVDVAEGGYSVALLKPLEALRPKDHVVFVPRSNLSDTSFDGFPRIPFRVWLLTQPLDVFKKIMLSFPAGSIERKLVRLVMGPSSNIPRDPSFVEFFSDRLPHLQLWPLTIVMCMMSMRTDSESLVDLMVININKLIDGIHNCKIGSLSVDAWADIEELKATGFPHSLEQGLELFKIASSILILTAPKKYLLGMVNGFFLETARAVLPDFTRYVMREYCSQPVSIFQTLANMVVESPSLIKHYRSVNSQALFSELIWLTQETVTTAHEYRERHIGTEDVSSMLRRAFMRTEPVRRFYKALSAHDPRVIRAILFQKVGDVSLYSNLFFLVMFHYDLLNSPEISFLLMLGQKLVNFNVLYSQEAFGFKKLVEQSPCARYSSIYAGIIGKPVDYSMAIAHFLYRIDFFSRQLPMKNISSGVAPGIYYLDDEVHRREIERVVGMRPGGLLTFEEIKEKIKGKVSDAVIARIPSSKGFLVTNLASLKGTSDYGLVSRYALPAGTILPYIGVVRPHLSVAKSNHYCQQLSDELVADPTQAYCSAVMTANHSGLGAFNPTKEKLYLSVGGERHCVTFIESSVPTEANSAVLWDYGPEFISTLELQDVKLVGLSPHENGMTTEMLSLYAEADWLPYGALRLPLAAREALGISADEKVWGTYFHHLLIVEPRSEEVFYIRREQGGWCDLPVLVGEDSAHLSSFRVESIILAMALGLVDLFSDDTLWKCRDYRAIHQKTMDSLLHYAMRLRCPLHLKRQLIKELVLKRGLRIDYGNEYHHSALFMAIDMMVERDEHLITTCLLLLKREGLNPPELRTLDYTLSEDESALLNNVLRARLKQLSLDPDNEAVFEGHNGYPGFSPLMYALLVSKDPELKVFHDLLETDAYPSGGCQYYFSSTKVPDDRVINTSYMSLALLMIKLKESPLLELKLTAFYQNASRPIQASLHADMKKIAPHLDLERVVRRACAKNKPPAARPLKKRRTARAFSIAPAKPVFSMGQKASDKPSPV